MIVNLDVIFSIGSCFNPHYIFLFHFRYRPLIEFCGTLFQRRNNIRPYMHMPPICQRLPLMRQLLTVLLVFMINLECSMEPTLLPLAGPGKFFEIYYYWFKITFLDISQQVTLYFHFMVIGMVQQQPQIQ